jgi:TnpA family transposase
MASLRLHLFPLLLWHLRIALRSGDIWVKNSRRYADPETYLIPKQQWEKMKSETCHMLGLPEDGEVRLRQRQEELDGYLSELNSKVEKEDGIRVDEQKLVISPLKAEELPLSAIQLQELIDQRLPQVDLCDLIIEVDSWVHYSEHFQHAGGSKSRNKDFLKVLFASILAQANNFGLEKMSRITGLSYAKLAWCTHWYLRDETFRSGINDLINYQFHQPLATHFGGGTMSSSDGQRFPVAVKMKNSASIPKYSGYGRILTFYTWTSDQQSQWQCVPVSSYVRDSTHILDGMLDNETELPLYEHASDTAGFSEKIFAFFDGLGFLYSPRIKDLGDQNLYSIEPKSNYLLLGDILKGRINQKKILKHWDTFLRVWASLKLGWVSTSLFISKLESQPRQSQLAQAFREYGKLIKSIYIPKYICREEQQRRVTKQLNKGEGLHDLRRWLMFANEGKIQKSQMQVQATQASALTLVTNTIVVWNTRYMQAIIQQLEAEGHKISDEDKSHISPCRFEHINKHGYLDFQIDREFSRTKLRPLRQPNATNEK